MNVLIMLHTVLMSIGLTDKKVAELMARSMDGDLDARPDQVILAHNAKRVLPKIRIIRKKLEAGESIRGLVGEDLDVIKEIFTLYPARYFQENEIDISDLSPEPKRVGGTGGGQGGPFGGALFNLGEDVGEDRYGADGVINLLIQPLKIIN